MVHPTFLFRENCLLTFSDSFLLLRFASFKGGSVSTLTVLTHHLKMWQWLALFLVVYSTVYSNRYFTVFHTYFEVIMSFEAAAASIPNMLRFGLHVGYVCSVSWKCRNRLFHSFGMGEQWHNIHILKLKPTQITNLNSQALVTLLHDKGRTRGENSQLINN